MLITIILYLDKEVNPHEIPNPNPQPLRGLPGPAEQSLPPEPEPGPEPEYVTYAELAKAIREGVNAV